MEAFQAGLSVKKFASPVAFKFDLCPRQEKKKKKKCIWVANSSLASCVVTRFGRETDKLVLGS